MKSRQPISLSSSSPTAFLFSCFIIFFITTTVSASSGGNTTEYEALLQFKLVITNEGLRSWNSSFHHCDWSGVSCGNRHKRVTALKLNSQGLEGSLSPYVGNLSFLGEFFLHNNNFQGTIPHELGRLSRLRLLQLSHNKFNGVIPTNLSRCFKLIKLGLSDNKLVGSIPQEISFLSKLTFIAIDDNKLTGGIPPVLGNITSMEVFSATRNLLGGRIPHTLGRWKNLTKVYIGVCNLTGTIPHFFYNLSLLTNFSLAENQLIGNISDQINLLVLRGNYLYGHLPSSIGNLVGLTRLDLSENRFTGDIPSTIGKLQKLQVAYLFDNQLSGPTPDTVGNLSLLTNLFLDFNRLGGHIPPNMGNCHNLVELWLNDNTLSGRIPKELLQLSSLTIILNLSHNNLFGSLPIEVGELKMLSNLDLSDNNLSGNIPDSLGGCASLSILSLKGNLFQGNVPSLLSSMRGVSYLYLSNNNLSGKIPQFLERFSFEYVNLSFNEFEGEVPLLGLFANESAFSILGNSRLCGGLVELALPKCKEKGKHKKKFPLFVIVLVIASTFFTMLCFAYVWRKKKKSQTSQASTGERFLKVSYGQLLKATNGFSQDSLIGTGGFSFVYKGILDHDNGIVAVKVLHLQIRGAHKSFIAECEAWWSIRHRNLLKIITSCSSVDFQGNDFKALVYEFMPNGSLNDWLHSCASTSKLNLIQRMNILN